VSRLPDKSLRRHTYGEFHRRTRSLASALQQLGLRKGDRVATLSWNHHAHLECYFGIPAAGGVMHTLNLRLSPDEIGWIAGHAQDRFLVVDDVLLPLYGKFSHLHRFEQVIVVPFGGHAVPASCIDYEALLAGADPDGFQYAPHDENDPVAMCYTSGTTGRPKGVVYSHRSTVLHTLVASLADFWGLRGTDAVLPVTPMFHANSWGVPYGAVMLGVKLVLPGPHLHPDDLLDLITQQAPTLALGVPTIWMSLIQAYEAAQQPGSPNHGRWRLPRGMRSLVGGAPVPESLIRAFDRHGVWILQGWGMTETSPLATVARPPRGLSTEAAWDYRATAGRLLFGVEGRIVDDLGEVQDSDGKAVGEVEVRGPWVTAAYYQDDDPAKFDDGWLRTGDVGTIDPRGYITLTDRAKDVIKSGGEWISSVELEGTLMAHPKIREAAVVGVPDERWDERPLAAIVVKEGETLSAHELQQWLADRIVKWWIPERWTFIDEVPKTSVGKFDKKVIRKSYADGQLSVEQL
jgi:fatty-acyl-CoA synthase